MKTTGSWTKKVLKVSCADLGKREPNEGEVERR